METSSLLLAICGGNSPIPSEFPTQRPVTRSFDVFFDLRLNKRLSKQWWGWWFETLLRPLWCHRNVLVNSSTAKLTDHLQNFVVITLLELGRKATWNFDQILFLMDESLVKWAGPCLTFMTASAVEVEEFILRPMYVLVSLGNQQLVADPCVIQILQQEVLKQKGSLFTASQLMFGGWFNIKVLSYQYRESHRGDKTVQCKPIYREWWGPSNGTAI